MRRCALAIVSLLACRDAASSGGGSSSTASTSDATSSTSGAIATSEGTSTTTNADSSGSGGPHFDLGVMPDLVDPTGERVCTVVDDMDAVGHCREQGPPDSFTPVVEWSWEGGMGETNVVATPLVANLTDDDGNGTIDLCDVPDIVVVTYDSLGLAGHIWVLDGATGDEHFRIDHGVDPSATPALGDIDDDGLPEIVATELGGRVVAFEHDGALAWQSTALVADTYFAALALADVQSDGDVDIIAGAQVFTNTGDVLLDVGGSPQYSATLAADLDGDDEVEIVLGHSAWHGDGTALWETTVDPGFPQVANLDDDPEPEVLVTNRYGLALIDHDGTVQYEEVTPTDAPVGGLEWLRPATIHDFDGDGFAEIAMSSRDDYNVFEADGTVVWSAAVVDESGVAAGTAFDFLGDGIAEAMYADEFQMFVYDELGASILAIERTSLTGTEYPVVVDVDADGSAEIVVVSNLPFQAMFASPAVQVIGDVDDRWIQARRIWNQHTYHVTNVREDGTIPVVEPHHWELLNTFRTNAQIEAGGICMPDARG
ncbi:MAG TPA: hypothetical protein VG755_28320 [Nannocystaceae bacterium]|nr:hypothetical protein [Nannocystaceae bacterium]